MTKSGEDSKFDLVTQKMAFSMANQDGDGGGWLAVPDLGTSHIATNQ